MLSSQFTTGIDLGAQCFFNGLIKELDKTASGWSLDTDKSQIVIPLYEAKMTLRLNYCYLSQSGPHEFRFPCLIQSKNGDLNSFDFADVLKYILAEPRLVGHLSDESKAVFHDRVLNSHENTEFSLNKRIDELPRLFAGKLNFIEAEQALFAGHNMHPAPKSRSGFNADDFAYVPESGEAFGLNWFALAPDYVYGAVHQSSYQVIVAQIVADLKLTLGDFPADFQLFPVHPWQATRLLAQSDIQLLLKAGTLINLGVSGQGWRATTSLRAIYHPQCRYMLKFSLSVKLTNSVRHLSLKEVQRGMLLEQILDSDSALELAQRYPDFTIMREPGFMAITIDDTVLEQSLVAFRVNPFMKNPNRHSLVLATLTQANPLGGMSMLGNLVAQRANEQAISNQKSAEAWFGAYLEKVLEPLLVARSDYGLIFLAHQQNIVVDLHQGLPSGLFYRDCQGTGFTCAAQECFSQLLGESAPENFMPHQYVNPFISYYLIFNSSFSVISALAGAGLAEEAQLLAQFRLYLEHLAQRQYRDNSFMRYLLDSEDLIFKGNFFVYLSNINENTIDDPSTIYRSIQNPLRRVCQDNTVSYQVKRLKDNRLMGFELTDKLGISCPQGEVWLSFSLQDTVLEVTDINAVRPIFDELQILSIIEHFFTLSQGMGIVFPVSLWQQLTLSAAPQWMSDQEGVLLISLGQFEQEPSLWLTQDHGGPFKPSISGEFSHPQRPSHPKGEFYRRFNYELGQEISFRLADVEQDIGLFHQWMNQPRVASFWELNKSKEDLKDYLIQALNHKHQFPVIAMLDGIAFGYFELYWAKEDRLGRYYEAKNYDRGLHLLIGNDRYLGSEYWRAWGQALRQYCFISEPRTERLVGEPRVDNARLIKIWEYFGYQKIKEFDFPHKRSSLVMLTRDDAFFPKMPR
jgi:siderophore synthetase component/RimJ/RimL family protein N-acetyltransferase